MVVNSGNTSLEMESEQHLIEQIWDSVKELVIHVANIQPLDDGEERDETIDASYNRMSWKWINLLLSHVVSSERPIVRKLGIYRLLKGQVGIVLDDTHDGDDPSATATAPSQKRHGKKKSRNVRPREATKQGATVDRITSQFLLTVLLPAWDSFGSTIGYTMHLENNRKVEKEDMRMTFSDLPKGITPEIGSHRSNPITIAVLLVVVLPSWINRLPVLLPTSLARWYPAGKNIHLSWQTIYR